MFNMKKYIWIITFTFMACSSQAETAEKQLLNAEEFSEIILKDTTLQIVDVRTPEEYQEGHISHAKNINWNDPLFKEIIEDLDKSRPLYIYCRSGKRSAAAAEILIERGFEVIELQGGILHWQENQLPITK